MLLSIIAYEFTEYIFQNLQYEQSSRIKELEKEISIMRGKHSDGIMQLKSRFLKEKRDYLHDAASKVVTMAKEANQVQSHISLYWHKNCNFAPAGDLYYSCSCVKVALCIVCEHSRFHNVYHSRMKLYARMRVKRLGNIVSISEEQEEDSKTYILFDSFLKRYLWQYI